MHLLFSFTALYKADLHSAQCDCACSKSNEGRQKENKRIKESGVVKMQNQDGLKCLLCALQVQPGMWGGWEGGFVAEGGVVLGLGDYIYSYNRFVPKMSIMHLNVIVRRPTEH